ncbi:MAG TPA: hypothetical protein VNI77_03790 [Nitrososphaera sp.]|nr:hypothetical protein [Nitrososphaera sp.]
MSRDNRQNSKKKLLVTAAALAVIAIAYATVAVGSPNLQQSYANAPDRQHFRAPAYKLEVDAPLNGPNGAVQVITVERGSAVTVPVYVTGMHPAGNTNMPVRLVVELDAKLGNDGAPDGSVNLRADGLQGLVAQFQKSTVNVNAGSNEEVDLPIHVNSQVPTGTYVLQLRGISQEYNVGTIIYLEVI